MFLLIYVSSIRQGEHLDSLVVTRRPTYTSFVYTYVLFLINVHKYMRSSLSRAVDLTTHLSPSLRVSPFVLSHLLTDRPGVAGEWCRDWYINSIKCHPGWMHRTFMYRQLCYGSCMQAARSFIEHSLPTTQTSCGGNAK